MLGGFSRKEIKTACLRGIARLPCAYGMTLRRWVHHEIGRNVAIGEIYLACEQLEQEGLIAHMDEPGGPERGNRKKRVWMLT